MAGGIRLESSKKFHLPPCVSIRKREKEIDDPTRRGMAVAVFQQRFQRERERATQKWWQGVGGASAALGVLVKCASAVPRSVQAGGWSPFRDVYGCVVAKWLCAIA